MLELDHDKFHLPGFNMFVWLFSGWLRLNRNHKGSICHKAQVRRTLWCISRSFSALPRHGEAYWDSRVAYKNPQLESSMSQFDAQVEGCQQVQQNEVGSSM